MEGNGSPEVIAHNARTRRERDGPLLLPTSIAVADERQEGSAGIGAIVIE